MIEEAPYLDLSPDETAVRTCSNAGIHLRPFADHRHLGGERPKVECLAWANLPTTTEFAEDDSTGAATRTLIAGSIHRLSPGVLHLASAQTRSCAIVNDTRAA